jgi:2-methylisocitrate lyase-like PEP mutase family enzyme
VGDVDDQAAKTERFLDLHQPGNPLLLPNAWDVGSARVLASLGFEAIATTSSGYAATLGLLDGSVTREQALEHCAQLVAGTELPVSADLENGFGDEPAEVARTIGLARESGLAGCSIEDFTGDPQQPIYDFELAVERVAAAAQAAHEGSVRLVLTARAENHLHGRDNLSDTIARLHAFEQEGADVLYAPGITRPEAIREMVTSLERPINVLARPTSPPVAELAELGVARISVGGAFAFAALGSLVEAAREFRERGTYAFEAGARLGLEAARQAFERR